MVVLEIAWLEMVLHQLKIINNEHGYIDTCMYMKLCVPCSKK